MLKRKPLVILMITEIKLLLELLFLLHFDEVLEESE